MHALLTAGFGRCVYATQQLKQGVQRNRFCSGRHTGQTHAGGQRTAGSHTFAQPRIERAQPHGIAKRGCVLQRALQHLGVEDRHLGLAKTDTARLGEFGHFGQHFALEATRQRAQRKHPCKVQLFRAKLQHVH